MQLRRILATVAAVTAGVLLAAGCSSSSVPGSATTAGSPSQSGSSSPAPSTHASTPTGTRSRSTSPAVSGTHTAAPAGPDGGAVPAGFTPMSATFVSADTGWVLGTAPCSKSPCTSILRTRDGGRSWRGIPAPRATLGQPDSGRYGGVAVVRFADNTDGWAAVGQLWATHDGGGSWHQLRIGGPGSVVSALETGGGYVFASTSNCPSQGSSSCAQTGRVYASPIGRDQWRAVSPVLAGATLPGLVVSRADWFEPSARGIYHGHGTSAPVRLPNPCPLANGVVASPALAVADVSHLDALCVSGGAAGTASYQLYGTSDGGRHWQRTGPSHLEPTTLSGITDNAHGVLLAAVSSGASELLRTTNDGASFTRAAITAPSGGIEWADLGFTTATQAVVVLRNTALFLSRDAGSTWARVSF